MKRAFWRRSVRDEVETELAFHLEMTTRELMESGMTRQQARAEAERRFGDTRSASEECQRFGEERDRRARRAEYRDELRQDLTFAWRQLAGAPGFSLVAIATLALGIGATTAVFGALDAVVLRPLPFPHAERIVAVTPIVRDAGPTPPLVPEFLALRSSGVFDTVAGASPGIGISIKLGEVPEVVAGARVSAGYFELFGLPPEVGRAFASSDDAPEAPKVAMISDRLWTERFNRDHGVVGRTIQIEGVPQTIIGVMPPPSTGEAPPMSCFRSRYRWPWRTTTPSDFWQYTRVSNLARALAKPRSPRRWSIVGCYDSCRAIPPRCRASPSRS